MAYLSSVYVGCITFFCVVGIVMCGSKYSWSDDLPEESSSKTGLYLTRGEVVKLRAIFKKLPLHKPELKNIYELLKQTDGDLRLNLNALVPDLSDLKQRLLDDEEFLEEFLRTNRASEEPDVVDAWSEDDINLDPKDIDKDVEDRTQLHGWEGCKADYDMVVRPLTESYRRHIIVWLRERLCNPVCPPSLPDIPDIVNRNPVALPLIDAHGHRPTGMLEGGLHWVGTVEECHDTGVRWYHNKSNGDMETREFIGKYVRVDIPVVSVNYEEFENLSFPLLWPFAIGICVPDTCTDDDIIRYIMHDNEFLMPYMTGGLINRNVTYLYSGQVLDFSNDPGAKAVVSLLCILIFINLIATCYDGCGRRKRIRKKIKGDESTRQDKVTLKDIKKKNYFLYGKPSFGERAEVGFCGFSFYSTFHHLYNGKVRSGPKWHVPSLDGLRAISFLWGLTGYTYIFGPIEFGVWCTTNLVAGMARATNSWNMVPVFLMYYSNYTMLFVCGFLCVHMFYKSYARNNRKLTVWFILRYFIHRWWSIVPTALMLMTIYTWYYPYMGDGPFTGSTIGDAENCKESWWMILTMFNNLFNLDKQCFGWFWFYSIMWQLHIVSIFVLVPLVKKPKIGYVMLALMYITYVILHIIWLDKSYEGEKSWYYDILQSPWCNAGPWIIGMLFAIIHKNHSREMKWHWFLILCFWVLSITGLYAVVYMPWMKWNPEKNEDGIGSWSKWGEISYDFLTPQIMALCVGWMVFASTMGWAGVVGSLLEWNLFIWISKAMIPMTVLFAPLINTYFTAILTPFYMHPYHGTYVFYGHLIVLFLYGNTIALTYTYPLSRGMMAAAQGKTRLELYLYGRHPSGLDQLSGIKEKDRHLWDKEWEEPVKERRRHQCASCVAADPPPEYGFSYPNNGFVLSQKNTFFDGLDVLDTDKF